MEQLEEIDGPDVTGRYFMVSWLHMTCVAFTCYGGGSSFLFLLHNK